MFPKSFSFLITCFYAELIQTVFGNQFPGLELYYNRRVPINKPQPFLIATSNIKISETTVELHTPTYVIASFIYPTGKGFLRTNNLQALCNQLKLTDTPIRPPKTKSYYVVVIGVFVRPGFDALTLTASNAITEDELFKKTYNITVKATPLRCFPTIQFSDCHSPHNPRRVPINRKVIVNPVVQRGCGINSKIKYSWSIRDFLDAETRYSFINVNSQTLRIPAYTFWFQDEKTFFHLLYVIKLKVEEKRNDGSGPGEAYARCYVMVSMAPPTATIKYGISRKVNAKKTFTVDGSESRDLSSPRNGINLIYKWSCSTDQPGSSFCKENMGVAQKIIVPAYKLVLSRTYNFTLKVMALRTSLASSTSQQITATHEDPLLITYNCIRNCLNRISNANGMIHLQGLCENCNHDNPTFKWSVIKPEAKELKVGSRFIIKPTEFPAETEKITIRLDAEHKTRKGFLSFEIQLKGFSKIGSCSIDPNEGIELATEFSIICKDFVTDFEPLTYQLFQDNQLLLAHTNSEMKLQLSRTDENPTTKLRVRVIDAIYNAAEFEIKASLKTFDIQTSFQGLMDLIRTNKSGQSLRESVVSGNWTSTIALIRVVSRHVAKLNDDASKQKLAESILTILKSAELPTTESLDAVSFLLKTLLEKVPPIHTLAQKVSLVLQTISSALDRQQKSKDIFDLSPTRCTEICRALVETAEKFFTAVDHFPQVYSIEAPKSQDYTQENYPDYGEMDFDVVYKTQNWQEFTESSRILFHRLGQIMFHLNQPEEENEISFQTGRIDWRMKVFGSERKQGISETNGKNYVNIPYSILRNLSVRNHPNDKFGIQIIFTKENLYWWYPSQYKMNTLPVTVNVFSYKFAFNNYTVSNISSEMNMFFELQSNNASSDSSETRGFVKPQDDMPIYQCPVPKNAYLVVQFQSTDAPIRVLVKIGRFPKYREIMKTYKVISKTGLSSRIRKFNSKNADTTAYIAIYPLKTDSSVNISFQFTSTIYSCNNWDAVRKHFMSDYCQAGDKSNSTHIHCRCKHLSVFAAKLFTPANSLDLPRDVIKALPMNISFLVVFLLVILLLILLMIWARRNDTADGDLSEIIFLESACSDGHYMYLITIETGSHRQAGTTANITFQLNGSNCNSEEYVVSCSKYYRIFRRNSETTFAIMTNGYLGALRSIILHNDCFGRYPSWYCTTVRVKDIFRGEEFIFLVYRWFSQVYCSTTRAEIELASESDLNNMKVILTQHFWQYFRELHLWYGLFHPHPRSPLNRIEKLTVILTGLCVGGMLSILLFERTTLRNIEDERLKYKRFFLHFNNFVNTLFSIIAGMFFGAGIMMLFFKSKNMFSIKYKTVYAEEK